MGSLGFKSNYFAVESYDPAMSGLSTLSYQTHSVILTSRVELGGLAERTLGTVLIFSVSLHSWKGLFGREGPLSCCCYYCYPQVIASIILDVLLLSIAVCLRDS